MNAIEPLHDLIEVSASLPIVLVTTAEGEALVELRLFDSRAAALQAVPTAIPRDGAAEATNLPPALAVLAEVRRQLTDYFAGRRRTFELPLDPRGTAFERRVWQQVSAIPYGQTQSYGEVARAIGRPKAFRAVGHANGSNPIPLIIPCHRVIGSDGTLTGYGGGLPLKRFLLELEGPPDGPPATAQLSLPMSQSPAADSTKKAAVYGIVGR